MRIAVISDIHANITALKAIIKHIEEQRIDNIIFLGDLVINGPHPKETMEAMMKIAPLAWVKGNTDDWFNEISEDFDPKTEREEYIYSLFLYAKSRLSREEIALLKSRPNSMRIEVEGKNILCVHGSHRSINEPIGIMCNAESIEQIAREFDGDILLCGHTHLPYFVSICGKKIINVGSVSLTSDGEPTASYGILDIHKDAVLYTNHKVHYDIEQVLNDAKIRQFPYLDMYQNKLTCVK